MLFRSAVVVLATLLSFLGWSPQAEHLTTKTDTSVSLGRPASIDEHVPGINMVRVVARHCQQFSGNADACALDPATVFYTHLDHNLRTTAGGDWQFCAMGYSAVGTVSGCTAQPAPATYIGLANDTSNSNVGTVAAGDTAINSSGTGSTEIAANGLSRANGTMAHTNGTASYTMQKVFSATGTQASNKAGLFTAASSGTMSFENLYTQVTVNNGDTLTVTWTINY